MIADHWLVGAERSESPNIGGPLDPRFLIIHYTAGPSVVSAVRRLTDPRSTKPVSAHIVIGRAGEIVQLAPFNLVTWHAGRSRWQSGSHDHHDLNCLAIGIELVNAGPLTEDLEGDLRAWWGGAISPADAVRARHQHEATPRYWQRFPAIQRWAAVEVARAVVNAYAIQDILGHDDVAPDRKLDPGPAWPMRWFRRQVLPRPARRSSHPEPGLIGRVFHVPNGYGVEP